MMGQEKGGQRSAEDRVNLYGCFSQMLAAAGKKKSEGKGRNIPETLIDSAQTSRKRTAVNQVVYDLVVVGVWLC